MTTTIAGTTATSNTTAGRPTSSEKPSTHPLTPIIGAEITGVNLAGPKMASWPQYRRHFSTTRCCFSGTKILPRTTRSPSPNVWEQLTGGHPTLPSPEGHQFILELDSHLGGRADHWHTGVTFAVDPQAFTATIFETEHPVVRVHPETGRPTLLLGGFARQIVGLPSDVSGDLLRVFASYVTRSEHIVRWRWSAGDVAIWDNRATQHYAVNDYGDAHRVMQRVTVSGVRPVGLDGWRSQARRGDAWSYQAGLGAPGGHLDTN